MTAATISRVRMRDPARRGRSRPGTGLQRGPLPRRALHGAGPTPMLPASPPCRRRALDGQLTPRTYDLAAAAI